jgi:hypothetical protein
MTVLKNLAINYIGWPILFIIVFIIIILILTIIFTGIYSLIFGVDYTRLLKYFIEVYGDFIFSFLIIIYKILTIPYQIIKTLIDVFSKFAIIFYFIVNMFNGFTNFVYDVTTVEM